MGAWGVGTFENDDAADWAFELESASDLEPVREALAAATDSDGYLEIPEAACAVAAAAVVAATFDGDVRTVPDEVGEWVDDHPGTATRGDLRLALDAVDRVLSEESELRALWDDAPQAEEWGREVGKLRDRLVRAVGDVGDGG